MNETTVDEVCKDARNKKETVYYTWGEISERIIWKYLISVVIYHVACVLSLLSYFFDFGIHSTQIKWQTILWTLTYAYATMIGTTAGAHRLWTHRTYKAKLPLRICLMIFFSGVGFNSVYEWVQDHRVHHKYVDTNADPHNSNRGFVFSHIGWLVMRRHPECDRKTSEIPIKDIIEDPVVMFQKRHVTAMRLIFCYTVPTLVPILFWNETILHAVLTQCIIRYIIVVNIVFSVNSVAHLWGSRPYNRLINPVENIIVSLLSGGEGSHNYHHTFPGDYKASELPYMKFNGTTLFIDVMAIFGLSYDRRSPSPEIIEKVIRRIGYKSQTKEVH